MERRDQEMEEGVGISSSASVPTCQCRICHEEEAVGEANMETPCACSGSLKFAHRGCVQRWCDEKGSTLCEICLQRFEPDYTVTPKKALVDFGVTIRGSLEVPRQDYVPPNSSNTESALDIILCSQSQERRTSCLRLVTILFVVVLLLRHIISIIAIEADHHVLTLVTVFILRASGIILPCYLIMRMILAIQAMQRQHEESWHLHVSRRENVRLPHHIIHIQA